MRPAAATAHNRVSYVCGDKSQISILDFSFDQKHTNDTGMLWWIGIQIERGMNWNVCLIEPQLNTHTWIV